MAEKNTLERLRARIDELDADLLDLLNRRARLATDVAQVKQDTAPNLPVYRPEREAALLQRIVERNRGPLSDADAAKLFREIMSVCLALEQELRIGFLGPQGTFTHAAAFKHFGRSVRLKSLDSIDEVFRETEAKTVAYGVVPVENSTEGSVNHTLDRLMGSPLLITGEVELRVNHCLLGGGEDRAAITTVYSHQQSFQQCRRWFAAHLPACEQISVNSTADAARRAQENPGAAAIAGAGVAEAYGLRVLEKNIEDDPGNTTRFLIVGDHPVPPTDNDKTSVLVSTRNRPGALMRLLQPLSDHNVSMTRIESRPARQANWQYVFFIDMEGHCSEEPLKAALAALAEEAGFFKLLGSYPKALY